MKNLMKALSELQSRVCVIGKDMTGHGYQYASFDKVLTNTRRALLESGIVVIQPVECRDGYQHVKTIVYHVESGEMMESTYALDLVHLKAANNAQQMGAAISYARRYAFLAALGIAAGREDTDSTAITPLSDEQKAHIKEQALAKDRCRELGDMLNDSKTIKEISRQHKISGGYDYVAIQESLEKELSKREESE